MERIICFATAMLLLANTNSGTFLNSIASHVFLAPDGQFAFALGEYTLAPGAMGLHLFQQRENPGSGWCHASFILIVPELQTLEVKITTMAWLAGSLVFTLNDHGYVAQADIHGNWSINTNLSNSLTAMAVNLDGWQGDGDTFLILSHNVHDPRQFSKHFSAYVLLNESALTTISSSQFPDGVVSPASEQFWIGQRFAQVDGALRLHIARTATSAFADVHVPGWNSSNVASPRRWLQANHVATNADDTRNIAIGRFPTPVVEVLYADGTSTAIISPLEGRFGAQLAIGGELLAVVHEPVFTNITYLLLYHLNGSGAQPLGYKRVHYTAGDWGRQGGQIQVSADWLVLRSSPSIDDYQIIPIHNVTEPDFDWDGIGMVKASNFTTALETGPSDIITSQCAYGDQSYTARQVDATHYSLIVGPGTSSLIRSDPITCVATGSMSNQP
jgi:hypothetical protein